MIPSPILHPPPPPPLSPPIMLSLPLLPCSAPRNPVAFDPIRRVPASKVGILGRGWPSKRGLGGGVARIGVSGQRNMSELVDMGALGRGSGGANESAAAALGRGAELRVFEATLNQMSKWLVAVSFGVVLLWKHDAEAMWAAMGSVVNTWLSMTLKKILNHERPNSALRSDPGMPSSHAQSIFYTSFFVVLSMYHWLGMNPITVGTASAILLFGTYLSWLRVSQRLHTISQVLVGAAVGSACSLTWFWMWYSFVLKAFIASIWVRLIVVLGSVTFCAAFLLYVVHHWLRDD